MNEPLEYRRLYEVKCQRCRETEVIQINPNGKQSNSLTNKVAVTRVGLDGADMENMSSLTYYICDNCWDKLIDFMAGRE